MNSGGKVREAEERAEMQERVWCATGSCVLSAMFMGTTLGGGMATLGGGSANLGVGTGIVGGVSRGGGDGQGWRHGRRCHGWIGYPVGEDVVEL